MSISPNTMLCLTSVKESKLHCEGSETVGVPAQNLNDGCLLFAEKGTGSIGRIGSSLATKHFDRK